MSHRRLRPRTALAAAAAPWARRLTGAAAGAAVVAVLVTGCSGGSSAPSGNASSPTSAISPAFVPSGRASLGTADTGQASTTVGQGLPTDPLSYARGMFEAWRDGNQPEAARYGSPAAVTDLFAKPYTKTDVWQGPNCSAQVVDKVSTSTCTWTATGGTTLTIKVRNPDLGNDGAIPSATFKTR